MLVQGLTVTCTDAVFMQLFVPVPVTEYMLVILGVTTIVFVFNALLQV